MYAKINTRSVITTVQEFHSFTFTETEAFFRNYPVCVEQLKNEEGYRIWMKESLLKEYAELERFYDLNKFILSKMETGCIEVPINHSLAEILHKKFKRVFLK